jgi:hypothetical protein
MDPTTNREPFPDDLHCALARVEWISARCKRLDADARLREAEQDTRPIRGTVGVSEKTIAREYRRRLPALREAEDALFNENEARLALNRDRGPTMVIDQMVKEFGLNEFEVTTLFLAVVPTLGHDHAEVLTGLSAYGFSGNALTVEAAWTFCELTPAQRLKAGASFLPSGALLRHGLVVMGYHTNSTPANLPGAIVEVSSAAFARLVGLPEFALSNRGD